MGAANVDLSLGVPEEAAANYGVSQGEEVVEDFRLQGGAGRERAGHVGARALVGQHPEVELGEEAGEVGERSAGLTVGEGSDPEVRDHLNWVFFQ